MSNNVNIDIVERAYALAEETTSTTSGKVIANAIREYEADGDLNALNAIVVIIETQMAQEHFYNTEILGGENDAY